MSLIYGKPLRIAERDVMDTYQPNWMQVAVPDDTDDPYQSYVMDDKDPLGFFLFPLAIDGKNVIVTYAGVPPALDAVGDDIALSDMYISAIVDFVVYRALSKDSRGGAPGVAEKYREKFLLALGASRQVLKNLGQNSARPPDATE